jgi:RNA polymerase sigma factor (sigma-70 family)
MVSQGRDALVEWVGRCVLPWEAYVRAWLRRASVKPPEVDDIVQEAYSRIARLEEFRHIANPRAYFLEVARNVLYEQLRRSRIIRIDTVAEMDLPNIPDDSPDPERVAIGKDEVTKLKRLIEGLPDRCRTMFVLRKIDGLTQRQIAERLGVTENTVETQVGRGLRLILKTWANEANDAIDARKAKHDKGFPRRQRD